MSEFDKHNPNFPIKRYLVSNRIPNFDFKVNDTTFIDCEVPFDSMGKHFSQTLLKSLPKIDEEYIILFCDDYFCLGEAKLNVLNDLLKMMETEKVDFISFSFMPQSRQWEKFHHKLPSLPDETLYYTPNNYMYLYSVQPCIWKKSSLLDVLSHNPDISLHHFDTTNIKNREGYSRTMDVHTSTWNDYPGGSQNYGFTCLSTDFSGFDEQENYNRYFVFPYVEIMRHGFFNMWHETNTKRFLEKYIVEKRIDLDENLKKFIYPKK
jgi:hypothetical protein